MKITTCFLEGIRLIEPRVYVDERGFFVESYQRDAYREAGITDDFIQDNHSRSVRGVLRGLHFTRRRPQAQIVTVLRGTVFDVVVDVRRGSATFGRWFGAELSDDGVRQVYMPGGFAHGFCVLSDMADLHYKVSERYDPADDAGLLWNDSDVNIAWPVREPIVSPRDLRHPRLRDLI